MHNRWFFIITFLFIVLFTGCSPSQQAVQTAIAQTAVAATATAEKAFTSTPVPTKTPNPTPTFTPSPTADPRIIDTDPLKLLCTTEDLPAEGKYFLPNSGWTSINTNEEVISLRGVEKGRDYVINTGRITGWWIARARGTRAARLPEELYCGVFMFRNEEGAKLALRKYNEVETSPEDNFKYLNETIDLGEENIIFAKYKIDSGGDKNTSIEIQYTYKNLMIDIFGYAKKEEDVPIDVLVEVGEKMLDRIKAEPLVAPEDSYFLNK